MVRVPTVGAGDLDKDTFDKKYRTALPVVIRGLAADWPAIQKWTPENLAVMGGVGDISVQPFVAIDGVHFLEDASMVRRVNMTVADVLIHVFDEIQKAQPQKKKNQEKNPSDPPNPLYRVVHTNGTTITTNSHCITSDGATPRKLVLAEKNGAASHCVPKESRMYLRGNIFPRLRGDISVPDFMSGATQQLDEELSGIWIGSAGCVTPLHFDPWHGILCQVSGRKRVTLFSPEDTEYIYPKKQPDSDLNSHISHLNLKRLSCKAYVSQFPLAQELTAWTVDLQAGDGLYIPPCWWHHVESLDPCISVPLRWSIGNRAKAIRNIGFRGWRRNRDRLRDDEDDDMSNGTTLTANMSCDSVQDDATPALDAIEIQEKAAKLMRREDLGTLTKEDAVTALLQHNAHVGRAAIHLRKLKASKT